MPINFFGDTNIHVALIITISAAVTLLLRALPFVVFNGKKETPKFILYLSDVLPYAVMGMLVVYCLKNINFLGENHGIPELISVAVVAGLHAWRKNTLLSIIVGTALYMILLQNWDVIVHFILSIPGRF